jgi:hypothetical protein
MEGFYLRSIEGIVKMEQAEPANLREYEANLSNGLEKPVGFGPSVRTEEFYQSRY